MPALFTFLLVVQLIVGAALVTIILVQKSEGGGLTSGGSPAGLMSARGAADFLTRTTAILATAFVVLTIGLAFIAATRNATNIDTSLNRTAPAGAPAGGDAVPAAGGFGAAASNAAAGTGSNSAFASGLTPGENKAAPASNGAVPVR